MSNLARFAKLAPFLLVAMAFLLASDLTLAGEPASSSAEMLVDAELHDVVFLDPDRGWAVGDRGVIWQTEDAGRRWQLIDSPTTARLRSICFVDDQHGWIAGGWIHPYTHRTSAVLLRTENGGKKWNRIEVSTIPALKRVRFTTSRSGWALGDVSPMHAAGLFHTTDGGYSWTSPPDCESLSFTEGDFVLPRRPALQGQSAIRQAQVGAPGTLRGSNPGNLSASLIDVHGVTVSYSNGKFNPTAAEQLCRSPRSVRFSNAGGWLVGQHGAVLCSQDGGISWRSPGPKFPRNVAAEFDWQAVSVWGDHCWIGGVPGSGILHSPDQGNTWQLQHTGQPLPINQIYFLDDQHGWAVCPLGRILSTRDGGQSWRIQRSGGDRAGLVAIHANDKNLPLELLAKTAADEGHLTTVITLSAGEAKSATDELLRDACSRVGAVSALRIPELLSLPPDRGTITTSRDDPNTRRGELSQQLERHIVRQLRIWRPDVVLTDSISASGDHSAGHQAAQVVIQAVQRASDPAVFSDQIVVAGLQPWTVRKVAGAYSANESARLSIDTGRLSMQLGCSLADYTISSHGLLSDSWSPSPRAAGYRLLWSQASQDAGNRDLFSGIPLSAVGQSRREVRSPPPTQIDGLLRTAQQTRNLQEIAAGGGGRDASLSALLPQIDQLVQGQEPAAAGRLMHRLAQQFLESGQYPAAADCLNRSVERFPDHALSDAALLWLLRYYSSAELQHAFQSHEIVRLPAPSTVASAPAIPPVNQQFAVPNTTLAQQATFTSPVESDQPVSSSELERVLRIAEFIQQSRPSLYADARIQFPLISVQRRLGKGSEATRILNTLSASQLAANWRNIASDELRLADPRPRSLRPAAHAARAGQKPILDGDLNDPCWQSAMPILLPSEPTCPTEAKFTFDDEYLFVSWRCAGASLLKRGPKPTIRARDAAVGDDHVDLWLDIDRDYQTSYQFTTDQSGQTREACGGDIRWNPQWFVASSQRDGAWSTEIAIPFAELTAAGVAPGEVWCIRLQRKYRGTPISWPEGESFGLLMFSDH